MESFDNRFTSQVDFKEFSYSCYKEVDIDVSL